MMATFAERIVDIIVLLEEQTLLAARRSTELYSFLDLEPRSPLLKGLAEFFRSLEPNAIFKCAASGWDYKKVHGDISRTFAECVSEGDPLEALCSLMYCGLDGISECKAICFILLRGGDLIPELEPDTNRWRRYNQIAEFVYNDEGCNTFKVRESLRVQNKRHNQSYFIKFKTRYLDKQSRFGELVSLINEYRRHPDVKAFVNIKRRGESFSRKDAVLSIFDMTTSKEWLLESRSFTNILETQRALYETKNNFE
jgi:hypothetical protein